jgi:AraC-like DNA-binding protein
MTTRQNLEDSSDSDSVSITGASYFPKVFGKNLPNPVKVSGGTASYGHIIPRINSARYLFLEPTRRGPLRLVCAGWEKCAHDFIADYPSFRWYALDLLASGQWLVRVAGRWVPADAGCILVYGPGLAGGVRATGAGPHTKYFVDFAGPAARKTLDATGLVQHRRRQLTDTPALQALFEQLLSCAHLPATKRSAVADALLSALLLRIGAEPQGSARRAGRSLRAFEKCREYLSVNFGRITTLSAAAHACGVGPEYLSRLFRQHTGETAATFLARVRMNHAAKLLKRDGFSVKAAGFAVGFRDPYHFSRAFKAVYGVCPRTFTRRT